jgi:nucleosome binding factor SPN SPT16 subunit
MSQVNAYMQEHAGVFLYSWGSFEELCSGSDDFSKEVRTQFREECANSYDESDPEDDDDSEKESDDARSISEEEQEDFCQYLHILAQPEHPF